MSCGPSVCQDCIEDPDLRDFIESAAFDTQCSFCGASDSDPIAALVTELADYMRSCLAEYYDDAANHLPYIGKEGGSQGVHWDAYDLLVDELEIGLPNDNDDSLLRELTNCLGDQTWCEAAPFSLDENDRLRFSWEQFCELIKHRRRFFFLSEHSSPHSELLDPAALLETISDFAQTIECIKTISAGSSLYRARYQDPGETLETAQELGPPPFKKAIQANRMSPPGIVMFYVAHDPETALRETAIDPGDFVIGKFTTCRDAHILDLTGLPPVPGIFRSISDSLEYNPRRLLTFLHGIAEAISEPIARDDRIHVNYVPTQVVTEFFRTLKLEDGTRLDGIRFSSTRHAGHSSLVLFADQGNLALSSGDPGLAKPKSDRWIRLIGSETTHVTEGRLRSWAPDEAISEPSFAEDG